VKSFGFTFFFTHLKFSSFGTGFAVSKQCQMFEAKEVLRLRRGIKRGGSLNAAGQKTVGSLSTVTLTLCFTYSTGINRNWHASCKETNVSKILDWLVL